MPVFLVTDNMYIYFISLSKHVWALRIVASYTTFVEMFTHPKSSKLLVICHLIPCFIQRGDSKRWMMNFHVQVNRKKSDK